MKLSTRSTYGMRALVELGLKGGQAPLSAALIAKQQDLSVAYLEQLLHRLKVHGLVSSVRGPKGGYLLAKDPGQISVAEIVRILDGPPPTHNGKGKDGHLSTVHVAASRRRQADRSSQAGRHAQRIAHAVFHCVHERLASSLDEVTLQDLCNEVQERSGESLDHRYVFHI
jgi:Rrf2 family protein